MKSIMAEVLISPTAEISSPFYPSQSGNSTNARGAEPSGYAGFDRELLERVGQRPTDCESDSARLCHATRSRSRSLESFLNRGDGEQLRVCGDRTSSGAHNEVWSRLAALCLSIRALNKEVYAEQSKQLNESVFEGRSQQASDGPLPHPSFHFRNLFTRSRHSSNPSLNHITQANAPTASTINETQNVPISSTPQAVRLRPPNSGRIHSTSTILDQSFPKSDTLKRQSLLMSTTAVSPLVRSPETRPFTPSLHCGFRASQSSGSLCASEEAQLSSSSAKSAHTLIGSQRRSQLRQTPRLLTSSSTTQQRPLPVDADIIEIYSTTPDRLNFRHKKEGAFILRVDENYPPFNPHVKITDTLFLAGTWFVQALCDVLEDPKLVSLESLSQLFQRTNAHLADREGENGDHQVAQMWTSQRYELFFFPGISTDLCPAIFGK